MRTQKQYEREIYRRGIGDLLGRLLVPILLLALPLTLYIYAAAVCSELGEMTQRRTEYRILSGCYIEVDGRFIHRDSWRGEYDQ